MKKNNARSTLLELAEQCQEVRRQTGRRTYDQSIKKRVRDLIATGASVTEVSKALRVSYNAVRAWGKLPPDGSDLQWMTVTEARDSTVDIPAVLQFKTKDFELTISTRGRPSP
jgi:transposase